MITQRISKRVVTALAALAVLIAPASVTAQESGADVWARSCGRCHRHLPPNKYTALWWEALVGHMGLQARLTSDEESAVREFLMGTARRLAAEETNERPVRPVRLASSDPTMIAGVAGNGRLIFERLCVACHGEEGKGDGPAAVALNPRPADLSDPERMGALTDEQLLDVLTEGKGAMPPFSALLTPEERMLVKDYVRSLQRREDS